MSKAILCTINNACSFFFSFLFWSSICPFFVLIISVAFSKNIRVNPGFNFLLTEFAVKYLQAHPHLGRGANILDSIALPYAWLWVGAICNQWILHGVLVHLCCPDQACWENSSQNDVGQWFEWAYANSVFLCQIKNFIMWRSHVACDPDWLFCFLGRSKKIKKEERFCEGCWQRPSSSTCGPDSSVLYICCARSHDGNYLVYARFVFSTSKLDPLNFYAQWCNIWSRTGVFMIN